MRLTVHAVEGGAVGTRGVTPAGVGRGQTLAADGHQLRLALVAREGAKLVKRNCQPQLMFSVTESEGLGQSQNAALRSR
jgi:hypothetical protein